MKQLFTTFLFSLVFMVCFAQSGLKTGPWAGNVELRTATIWAEVLPTVKSVAVRYYPVGAVAKAKTVKYKGELGLDFNPVKIDLNTLDLNTTYQYDIIVDGRPVKRPFKTQFTTKELWQYRKPAPDFTFLAGSCAYINEPEFDRPGRGYGGDSTIFETMAKTPASFHIWMGDDWYTREVDYTSVWGMNYRPSRDRSIAILQPFMAAMPQYHIWDDHDYGPNDAGSSFIFKEDSRRIFSNYSTNPTYGQEGQGIYTQFGYSDVDFFLTDARYFRSNYDVPDFDTSQNMDPSLSFFGQKQMDWLKNALRYSNAAFKIVVVGSQVLNPLNPFECMRHYGYEHKQLMEFLAAEKIPGVIFFTGDRHHSEVVKIERPGLFPLYDVTASPYTAGVAKPHKTEDDNPYRVAKTLVNAQNFARVSVSGKRFERVLKVDFVGLKGEVLGSWQTVQTELQLPRVNP